MITTLIAVNELKLIIKGKVILPDDDNYDAVRKVWNSMIDRRPKFIAQCASANDVVSAVNYGGKEIMLEPVLNCFFVN